MKIALNDDALSLVVDALEKQHRETAQKAESWSFDLEGDYDTYVEWRKKELELAAAIHMIKTQRTYRRNNPSVAVAEEPLAEWEVQLLTGQPVTS